MPAADLLPTEDNADTNIYIRLTYTIADLSNGTQQSVTLALPPGDAFAEGSTDFSFHAGDVISLAGDLTASTDATPDLQYGAGSLNLTLPDSLTTTANAFDTALFGLDVLTPGVTYSAESGTIYPTTLPHEGTGVPERASLALLGTGLVGVGLIRRRRSSC